MLNKLLEVYGDMLVNELEEDIYEDNTYEEYNYNPSQGSVSGLIYYKDTEQIGKGLMNEFLETIADYGWSCGSINERAQGNIYNYVAWFMWEFLISTYKEDVIKYVKENSDMFNSEEDGKDEEDE
jgi:hypothetical protein